MYEKILVWHRAERAFLLYADLSCINQTPMRQRWHKRQVTV